ncbi:MAG: SAM-dependent methyltransferase [Saprospiraceae bacterium]
METLTKGLLYLVPVPLGEEAAHTLPAYVADVVQQLDVFIVERAKTARRFLRQMGYTRHFDDCTFYELNKHTLPAELPSFLALAEQGRSIGLMSEAGVPAVADPGSQVVALAHRQGIGVIPLVGPSSLLLALMGSGMNGQAFAFKGYLGAKRHELTQDLKKLENLALRHQETQIFIETPYRNQAVFEAALQTLQPNTRLTLAMDLTLPTQYIRTLSIHEWHQQPAPDMHKRLAVFVLGG